MTPDLSAAVWRKSSRSGGEGGNCIELAWVGAVRDSKNPDGAHLEVGDVRSLVRVVKADRLAR